MGEACVSEASSVGVLEVSGEPVIIINGVPNAGSSDNVLALLDTASIVESKSNHGYGRLLEGRKVEKLFGLKKYAGEVVKFDEEMNWYQVVYEDGDFEDMEWHELQEVLLPLHIGIPLTELALQALSKCKPKPGIKTHKSRKGHIEIIGGKAQAAKLVCGVAEAKSRSGRQIKPNARYQRSTPEKSKGVRKTLAY